MLHSWPVLHDGSTVLWWVHRSSTAEDSMGPDMMSNMDREHRAMLPTWEVPSPDSLLLAIGPKPNGDCRHVRARHPYLPAKTNN